VIGGIVNQYTDVTIVGPCANKVTVSNATGFVTGQSVILIQMQGATMDETNTAGFGSVINPNAAGLWEKAVIHSVVGNVITFNRNLLNNYAVGGNVQLVSLPVYSDAIVSTTLTGDAWNGSTGGVIALEVSGTLTLQANIDASGIGFRGGSDLQVCTTSCNVFHSATAQYYSAGDWRAAYKGEGISAIIAGKELGKGRQTNGGGGANLAANGGGGGSNYAVGGSGGANNEPGAFNCQGNNQNGLGGLALGYADRLHLFSGGGGGAGHGDNGTGTGCPGDGDSGEGGNGGGIVILLVNTIDGNGNSILSLGGDGDDSQGDGAGGGGGGGVIFINATNFSGNLSLDVSGGDGGSSNNVNSNRCFGTGGGGGAGVVLTNAALPGNVAVTANGGQRGFILNSSAACDGNSYASDGSGTGVILTGSSIPQSTTLPAAGCGLPVSFIHFSGRAKGNLVELKWATATEVDADYFDIERSFNNSDFTVIGRVAAAGNTSTRTDYTFTDSLPYPGLNHYRLRQVDITGYEKLTSVIAVTPETKRLLRNMYPSPLGPGQSLVLSLSTPEKDHGIQLLDIGGRQMASWQRKRQASSIMELKLPALQPGIYLLVLDVEGRTEAHKLVVQ
jgi:hypothetical protein